MKPMLAHLYKGQPLHDLFYIQPKLNGIRALYQNGLFWSRDEVMWNPLVVHHITSELVNAVPPTWILDGELYVHGWSLQQINSSIAVKRVAPVEATKAVTFNVFDAVSNRAFFERFPEVIRAIRGLKHTRTVNTHVCGNLDNATDWFNYYKRHHYEGIMYRLDPHAYTPNKRVSFLLKRKAWHDEEFRIVDYEEGNGKCHGLLGALICLAPNHKKFRVGTGFDDITRKLFVLDPPIGQLAKVQFIGYSDEGIPLNTSFQGLVDDA